MSADNPVKVFIFYSHDSEAHGESVCALAERLVKDEGIDVILDLWVEDSSPEQG